jgi:hypothetical protein
MQQLVVLLLSVLALTCSANQQYEDVPVNDQISKMDLNVEAELTCLDDHPTLTNFFSWADYMVLGAMLIISCLIGTFYACFSKKQETSQDFLLGGSDMGTFPMAMSLAASFITAIELLGNPAEMYEYVS